MRLLFILTFLLSLPVLAHQSSVTSSQKEIKWNYSNVPLRIVNNSSSLPGSSTQIVQAIAEWNGASAFKIQRVYSGASEISFLSDFSMYGSAVIGLTAVSYTMSGAISNAKIFLNEENFDFTASPGMAYGNTLYLNDVVTHELGHFSGLSHSEVLNSSMFYQNYPGQSELGADDIAGIRNKYDSGYGKISGHVKGGDQIGILGVHVQAISRKNGDTISTITDTNGLFEIGGLNLNDTYYLYTTNLKNLNALSSYLANVQTEFCPAAYASSFFSQCGRENDGLPQGISLHSSQKEVDVGTVTINCSLKIQEDYVYEKLQSTFNSLEVFNYALDPRIEKSYVGYFKPSDLSTTIFTAPDILTIDLSGYSIPLSKYLKLRLISQPLGNAVEYSMTVKQSGSILGTYVKSYNTEGTFRLDLASTHALSATTAQNTFEVEIKAKKLSTLNSTYSIPDFLSFGSVKNLPYLLVMSIETASGPVIDTGSVLSDNSSCLDAPFTYTVKNSTAQTDEEASSSAQAATAASCGTIGPPSGPGPGQFLGILSLGFLLSVLPSKFAKRNKKILS